MMKDISAAYKVCIKTDGSIFTEIIEPNDTVERRATTFDIYQSSKEIATDIESQLLADRVARTVMAQLQPKNEDAEFKQRILRALSDRDIDDIKP